MKKKPMIVFLGQMPLFQDLSEQELERVADIAIARRVTRKSVIFTEGSEKEAVFFIREGLVKTFKTDENGHEQIVSFLKTGDMFPHTGFFNQHPYPATAEAIVDTHLAAIPVRQFEHLMLQTPSIAVKLMRVMGEKIVELQEQLQTLSGLDVKHRVLSFLLKLAERHGTCKGTDHDQFAGDPPGICQLRRFDPGNRQPHAEPAGKRKRAENGTKPDRHPGSGCAETDEKSPLVPSPVHTGDMTAAAAFADIVHIPNRYAHLLQFPDQIRDEPRFRMTGRTRRHQIDITTGCGFFDCLDRGRQHFLRMRLLNLLQVQGPVVSFQNRPLTLHVFSSPRVPALVSRFRALPFYRRHGACRVMPVTFRRFPPKPARL